MLQTPGILPPVQPRFSWPVTPASVLGTPLSESSSSAWLPKDLRSDVAGPVHWLLPEACGQGSKKVTVCFC